MLRYISDRLRLGSGFLLRLLKRLLHHECSGFYGLCEGQVIGKEPG